MPLNPITGDEDPNILDGTADGDEILGLGGDDTIFGREGDDTIDGGAGDDTVDAGEGNDTIIYADGTDTLLGGDGDDKFTVSPDAPEVAGAIGGLIDGGGGVDTLTVISDVSGDISGISISDVENLYTGNGVTATAAQLRGFTHIAADFDASFAASLTLASADVVNLSTQLLGSSVVFNGSDGNDVITTSNGDDFIFGNGGVDTLNGGLGNDTIDGGAGDDTLNGGDGDDTLVYGDGIDTANGGADDDRFVASDVAFFEPVTATINGGSGFDSFYASANTDSDITGVSFTGVENLYTSGFNVTATAAQLRSFTRIAADSDASFAASLTLASAGVLNLSTQLLGSSVIFNGSDGNDVITTSNGDDFIFGNGGNDTLIGGLGNDFINGGEGNDIVDGGAGDDTIVSDSGVEKLNGGAGNDKFFVTWDGSPGGVIAGGAGTDSLYADFSNGDISGFSIGTVENLYTQGGILIAKAGQLQAFTQIALSDEDLDSPVAVALAAAGSVNLTAQLLGRNATITGSAGNDAITTSDGADVITGGEGNDRLNGGVGADTLIGGLGNDVYVVDDADDIVTENASEGLDSVFSSATWELANNVENLTLTGAGDLIGYGNELANILTGNSAANLLVGDAGNDRLNGGRGADMLIGGQGDDIYTVDNIGDFVLENRGEGIDAVQSTVSFTLAPNVENLVLRGTAEIDGVGNALANVLIGNAGSNILEGKAGNDRLDGGLGADQMFGGAGNDAYYVDHAGDVIVESGGEGTDGVNSSITFALGNSIENLVLIGNADIDGTGNELANRVSGNAGANILDGGEGNDRLIGGLGADTLIGGAGNDGLTGGADADVFMFSAAGDLNGVDLLTDFVSGFDSLRFTASDYGFVPDHVLTASEFTVGASAVGASAQFVWNAANRTLAWDSDGAGELAAIQLASFQPGATLTSTDLLFVSGPVV